MERARANAHRLAAMRQGKDRGYATARQLHQLSAAAVRGHKAQPPSFPQALRRRCLVSMMLRARVQPPPLPCRMTACSQFPCCRRLVSLMSRARVQPPPLPCRMTASLLLVPLLPPRDVQVPERSPRSCPAA